MIIFGSILGAGSVLKNTIGDPSTISPPPNPGDRYIVAATGTVAPWAGFENYIARYNGATWDFDFPVEGLQQYVSLTSPPQVLEWRSSDGSSSSLPMGWLPAVTIRTSAFPYLTLTQLDLAAGAQGAVLEIDADISAPSSHTMSTALVRFAGGVITVAMGVTLALKAIEAGDTQCFNVSASSSVATLSAPTVVNAKWFGAQGNGVANDTVALQAALDCAIANSTQGAEVYVPPGIYIIATTNAAIVSGSDPGLPGGYGLMISPQSLTQGFALRGAGGRSSIFMSALDIANNHSGIALGAQMLFVGRTDGSKRDGISIVDMGFQSVFDGAKVTGTGTEDVLVNLNFCRDAIVDRCAFIGGNNIQLYVGGPQGPQISNCDFFGLPAGGTATGIRLSASTVGHPSQACRINNCVIRDFRVPDSLAQSRRASIAFPGGIFSMGGSAIGVNFDASSGSEFAITDCDIENCDCLINMDSGRNQVVRNSMETGTVSYGIAYASGNLKHTGGTIPNAGNGYIQPDPFVPVGYNAVTSAYATAGVYSIACTNVTSGVATFTVTAPGGATVQTVAVGPTAPGSSTTEIFFTIYPGSVAFAVGDSFTVNVLNAPAASFTYSGTGTGTLALDPKTPILAGAQVGVYRLVYKSTFMSTITFTLVDPRGVEIGDYSFPTTGPGVSVSDELQFTLTNGATSFTTGDTFLITVSSLSSYSLVGYSPSVSANPGVKNTGTGTVTFSQPSSTVPPTSSGIYTLTCTTAVTGGGIFAFADPQGVSLGNVTVGTAVTNNQIDFTINAGGTDFIVGDSFQIDMIGDVLVKVGRNAGVTSSFFTSNTMSGDAITNQRFFDLYNYREIYIDRNLFISELSLDLGQAVRLGKTYNSRASYFRWNDGFFNPRTNIYFDPQLPEGSWFVYGNSEGISTTPGADAITANSSTPIVANLATAWVENTARTTITNFSRGYTGQSLSLFANTGPAATLQTGGNITMLSGLNEPVLAGLDYEFRATLPPGATSPVWQQIATQLPVRTLDSDTVAYLNAGILAGAPVMPLAMQYAVDDLVLALKAASMFTTGFDAFYLFAVNDWNQAKINLVKPTGPIAYTLAATGTLNFQPYYGVASDGSSYAAGAMPLTTLTNYAVGNGALTVWPSMIKNGLSYAIGTATGAAARLAPYRGMSTILGRVNDNGTFISGTSAVLGLTTLMRTATSGTACRSAWRNGATVSSDNQVENSFSSDTFQILRDGNAGSPIFHTFPIAMAAIGSSRSSTQEMALYNAVRPYMAKLGMV